MSVFDLEKLAQLVASRMGSLLVKHQRCSRVRSPLSKCTLCVDICPRGSLSFGQEGIEIADNCLECGLCASACSTGALETQEPTELALLDKIQATGEQGGTVALGCRREKELNPRCLVVPCLGSLSWELMLAADQAPFPIYLVFVPEKCEKCSVKGGGENFLAQLTDVRKVLQGLKIKGEAIRLVTEAPPIKDPAKKSTADPGRRAFFRTVFTGAKQVPWVMLQSVLEQPQPEGTAIKAISGIEVNRLNILKRVLRLQKDSMLELELLKRPTLGSVCHFCRACAILCPVGALKCSVDYQLTLDTGLCTGCGLCTELCLHKSLVLKPRGISELYQDTPITLAEGIKGRCRSCGQELIASEAKEICFICEKKASWQAI